MGLDMFLNAHLHLTGYSFYPEEQQKLHAKVLDATGLADMADPETPSIDLQITVAYWRKANQIHAWFVKNVQDGKDECQESYVERDQIIELRNLVKEVLAEFDPADPSTADKLPPQGGFFFGSTDIDDWYRHDLEDTVKQLDRVIGHPQFAHSHFYYRASW